MPKWIRPAGYWRRSIAVEVLKVIARSRRVWLLLPAAGVAARKSQVQVHLAGCGFAWVSLAMWDETRSGAVRMLELRNLSEGGT